MTVLDDARAALAAAQGAVAMTQKVVDELSAASAPTGPIFGHHKSLRQVDSTLGRELSDMIACNGRAVRFDAGNSWTGVGGGPQTIIDTAHSLGFKTIVIVHGGGLLAPPVDRSGFVQDAVSICRNNPTCIIEIINEANLHSFTAAQAADLYRDCNQAIKAAGLTNVVLLGSVGNSRSKLEGLMPLDWCKALAARHPFKEMADWANYHLYTEPVAQDNWFHAYTPNVYGESCQNVFGDPSFTVSEFGEALYWIATGKTNTEAVQAAHIGSWVTTLAKVPGFRLGIQYALSDDAPGSGTGFGLRRHDLTHRPSWDAYRNAVAAVTA